MFYKPQIDRRRRVGYVPPPLPITITPQTYTNLRVYSGDVIKADVKNARPNDSIRFTVVYVKDNGERVILSQAFPVPTSGQLTIALTISDNGYLQIATVRSATPNLATSLPLCRIYIEKVTDKLMLYNGIIPGGLDAGIVAGVGNVVGALNIGGTAFYGVAKYTSSTVSSTAISVGMPETGVVMGIYVSNSSTATTAVRPTIEISESVCFKYVSHATATIAQNTLKNIYASPSIKTGTVLVDTVQIPLIDGLIVAQNTTIKCTLTGATSNSTLQMTIYYIPLM